jgi:hypothetical protein
VRDRRRYEVRFEEAARHIREAGDVCTWGMAAIGSVPVAT